MSAAFDFHHRIAVDAIGKGRSAFEAYEATQIVSNLIQARAWCNAARTNLAHAEAELRGARRLKPLRASSVKGGRP